MTDQQPTVLDFRAVEKDTLTEFHKQPSTPDQGP